MDSASSSLPPFSIRDVSPLVGAEEDGALLVAAGLAKEAALLFQTGKLVDCLRVLNHLLEKKEDDPKLFHNKAIAESIQGGCLDPRRLIKALENIKKQSEARASGEHIEVASNNGSKHTSNMRGSNAAHHLSSSAGYHDEFDSSIAMFNIAVIWYHLHEYSKSFSYLDILYQNIEPIGEVPLGTALRICLLLLDCALLSHNASRSAVISYMEKAFCVNSLIDQIDNGTFVHQQSLLVSKSSSFPGNLTIPDASHLDLIANGSENSLTITLSEEALEDDSLPLPSSLDIRRLNLEKPGITSSNDFHRTQADESISAADLRIKIHIYKIRLLLLIRNLKAAKREVKIAMNIARGKDYPMALYLKSQLEYGLGNHRKAIKLLMASSNSMETGFSSMYYNNLGCIYYRLAKHHTSGVFFSKALNSSSLVRGEKRPKLMALSQDKSLLITYNCGMHSLACGRPFHAARCFLTASLVFYNQPLLWLRIAECCLVALGKRLVKSISSGYDRSNININVIGKGKWRQLALRCGNSPNCQEEYVGTNNLFMSNGKLPHLSISLARQCLVNALFLLESSEATYSRCSMPPCSEESQSREELLSNSTNLNSASCGDRKFSNVSAGSSQVNSNGEVRECKGENSQSGLLHTSVLDYEHVRTKENLMMKQVTLADLAFVELALGNPLKALSTAKSLMELPGCSKIHLFFGIMYSAEALCMLNRPKEAAEHMMIYISGGYNVELPYSQEDCDQRIGEKVMDIDESNCGVLVPYAVSITDESKGSVFLSPEEARGYFCTNYAANFALLGDFEQAQRYVNKALSDTPNSSEAILTAIYVDLKRGNTVEALAKLKQHSGVRFLPDNLTLNRAS